MRPRDAYASIQFGYHLDGLVLVRYSLKRPLCDAAKAMDFLVIYPCIGKPPIKKVDVQTEFCQIVFQPPFPPPLGNGRFVGIIFAENL